MNNEVQGEGLAIKQLPSRTRQMVEQESQAIKMNFKKTVAGIISIGKSLQRIKSVMPRTMFLEHIKIEFELSEMMAHRFISVANKFDGSKAALSAKPSVLYLLTGAEDLAKVQRLAQGHSVVVGNRRVKLADLTIADATKIRKGPKFVSVAEPTAAQIDRQRCATAFQELGDLVQDIQSWSFDLVRFKKKGLEIQNKKLLCDTLIECKVAIGDCISALR